MGAMGLRISLEITDAATTLEDLCRFVDHARAADVDGDTRPTVARPDDAHTVMTLDLGDIDQLTRPAAWLSADDVERFGRALTAELNQTSDGDDVEVLRDLLAILRDARPVAD